jgi:hypothetical protein
MLSLLKKKSEAAAAPLVPPWHPNFRNYEKLPDIKVVRTAFFVNVGAITTVLALAGWYGFTEWQLRDLNQQLAAAEARIARDKPASDRALADFKKFQAEETKLKEVETFLTSKPSVSELLIHLAGTRPENVAIDGIDLREMGLILRLSVKGAPDVASGTATAYKEQLAGDKQLGAIFGEPTFSNFATNPNTGRLAVEILLPAKTPAKK